MGILDQFFVYHPEPWQDRGWKARSVLPLEDVWLQTADGAKLFGWYVENRAASGVIMVSRERGQHHQIEALAKDNSMSIVLSCWCTERKLLELNCDPFYLSTGETVDVVERNESVQAARNGYINQSIAALLLKGIIHCSG